MATKSRTTAKRTKGVYTAPLAGRMALVAVVIAIVSILERWSFPSAWGEAGSLTSAFYYGDATRFVDYAIAIARGQAYDNGIPYHPPGWPLLLALVLRLSGAAGDGPIPIAEIKLLTAVLSGLSVGIAALIAGEVAGFGALLAVAVLGPFNFAHIVEGTVANSEALYGLMVALATWCAWRWLHDDRADHRAGWAAAAAVTGGAATLVRAEYLLAVVLTTALAWVFRRRTGEVVAYAAILCAALAPVTVWHWRTLSAFNAAHVGRVAGPLPVFAPVTSYGPFNFAMANHEDADGGPNRDHPMLDRCVGEGGTALEVGQLDLTCPAIYDLYVNGYAIGARWLLTNPGAALTLLGRKAAFTYGFLAHGFFADDIGAGVDGVRRRVDLVDPSQHGFALFHLALFASGVISMWGRRVPLVIMAAPLVAFAASVLLFYGYVRLGAVYLPIVWVFEGAGAAALVFAATGREATSRTVIGILVTMALLAGYDRSTHDTPRRLVVDGPRSANGALIQDETVEIRRF